jgi:signal peptide peptidase SppA
MKSYHKVMQALFSMPWAVQPEKLEAIQGFLELKLRGGMASPETLAQIRAASGEMQARAQSVAAGGAGSIAVLPLYGLILQRGNVNDLSGPSCTSVVGFARDLRQAVNDPSVKSIVIDVDSPGGTVAGVDELAQEIYNARKQKKITAVSNCLCASAAYYLASQASEVVVSPSSTTGSIGVYATHVDTSKADEMDGLKFTLISYGAHKTDGNTYEPLSDAARADLQQLVDYYGGMFEKAVARGRGVKLEDVQKKFGQGRMFTAKDAVRIGLADRVGTLDDALASHGAGGARASVTVPIAAAAEPVADPQDGDGDDCACACAECVAGDCSACTHAECACVGCACDMAAKAAKTKAEHERMRMELQLAAA